MNQDRPGFVRSITHDTLALILAGGKGSRLYEMTRWRAKPSVYFGGKFRIVDFALSNCVNSGIRRMGILTQYKAHSLIRHIVRGWSRFQSELGEFVEILPASQRVSEGWYEGTADAIYQNLDIIQAFKPKYVLILAGDHIYKMDYGHMLAYHLDKGAKLTVACLEAPLSEASAFGVMTVDEQSRVVRFQEKPERPEPIPGRDDVALCSMGIYIFDAEFLTEQLLANHSQDETSHDFGKDIIPSVIRDEDVYAYSFKDPITGQQGYWRDVGTVDAFWAANMELLGEDPPIDLSDREWPVLTYQEQLPPAKFMPEVEGERASMVNSMLSGGCVISRSEVRKSVLYANVRVRPSAVVQDSVLFPDVDVGRHARLHKAVVDRGCVIPDGMTIGEDTEQDAQRFRVSAEGVTLVTREMLAALR
jgi:glucose-1-phosphate adenylyltransferase